MADAKYQRMPPRITREIAASRLRIPVDAIESVRRHSVNYYFFNYVATLAKNVRRYGKRGDYVPFALSKDFKCRSI